MNKYSEEQYNFAYKVMAYLNDYSINYPCSFNTKYGVLIFSLGHHGNWDFKYIYPEVLPDCLKEI